MICSSISRLTCGSAQAGATMPTTITTANIRGTDVIPHSFGHSKRLANHLADAPLHERGRPTLHVHFLVWVQSEGRVEGHPEIRNGHRPFLDVLPVISRLPAHDSAPRGRPAKRHGPAPGPVVSARPLLSCQVGRPPELTHQHHERVLPQSAGHQVVYKGSDCHIECRRDLFLPVGGLSVQI